MKYRQGCSLNEDAAHRAPSNIRWRLSISTGRGSKARGLQRPVMNSRSPPTPLEGRSNGTISIDVPIADVTEADPVDSNLHEVTASTMTTPSPAECLCTVASPIGVLFNLIDAAVADNWLDRQG